MTRGKTLAILALAVLLLVPWPARAVDKEKITAAVERGVAYLKRQQLGNGTWPYEEIGATALAALTLIECGVPIDDPAVEKAAAAVRQASVSMTHTYSLALAILFLDRIGEPVDSALIQLMTVRLMGGQTVQGGWSYQCPPPHPGEMRRLTDLLREHEGGKRGTAGPGREVRKGGQVPKEVIAQIEQIRKRRLVQPDPMSFGYGDNSNTQFAVLALWVARRHGLPVEAALADVDKRFRTSQNPDGGWGYLPLPLAGLPREAVLGGAGSRDTMTCAGLLCLGAGYAVANESALRTDPKAKDPTHPGAGGRRPKDPLDDKVIAAGLRAVANDIDRLSGGRPGLGLPNPATRYSKIYYYLWTLERMSVAFDFDTIKGTDWYSWGAEILLFNQDRDGGWTSGEFARDGSADTCFALLFLRRANLASDLTRALRGQLRDPIKAELTSGGRGGASLIKGNKPEPPAATEKDPETLRMETEAARMAEAAVEAAGAKQDHLIESLRDKKGAPYTRALAGAIAKLDGEARKKAREALADRLTRMTAATLGEMLKDEDLEVRRAAALAVAMKEDNTHLARLIELLDDRETTVSRAAYAALKSLTGQDFGPAADASRAEKASAIAAWKAWWKQQEKK
jgi:hypothetical protein